MTLVEEPAGAAVRAVPELPKRLEPLAIAAVRNAAMAAYAWAGRGDGKAADGAATEAMRLALGEAHVVGKVVIGEGEKDNAPMLYNGEEVGEGDHVSFDIAVDPVEGTDLCAAGQSGALTTIAFAGVGGLWSPGPAHYMDKLVVEAAARDAIDLRDEPERVLKRVAAALGKRPRDLVVVVLDKPRHVELIARLRACGARVQTPTAGDVGGGPAGRAAGHRRRPADGLRRDARGRHGRLRGQVRRRRHADPPRAAARARGPGDRRRRAVDDRDPRGRRPRPWRRDVRRDGHHRRHAGPERPAALRWLEPHAFVDRATGLSAPDRRKPTRNRPGVIRCRS